MSAAPVVVLGLVALLAATAVLYALGSRRLAPTLGALVGGPVCYFLVGFFVPRVTGEGRFFSVPFGGLHVGDSDLMLSVLAWSLLWWAVLYHVAKFRRRR